MNTLSLIQGLRFVDSFFPSGGFAFSFGLEASVKDGAVRDGREFAHYVEDLLVNGIGKREAVAVAVAHQAARSGRLAQALAVDHALEALKFGRDSRQASRQMGRQVIRAAAEQLHDNRLLLDYRAAVNEGRTSGHVAVAVGLTLAACGWSRRDTIAAFLYQTAQGLVSAAMKLLPVGQHQGQHLLSEWSPLITQLSHRIKPQAGLASWSPIQDIYAMRHARLESRLFRS
ncbi:MAG TPA: urease accessory UreF family protein [Nitrospira sp.]|nr:urease accessory UreF family protein [Nitrospira sp.]